MVKTTIEGGTMDPINDLEKRVDHLEKVVEVLRKTLKDMVDVGMQHGDLLGYPVVEENKNLERSEFKFKIRSLEEKLEKEAKEKHQRENPIDND
jgi:RIO-like serine/threonine protein kinase